MSIVNTAENTHEFTKLDISTNISVCNYCGVTTIQNDFIKISGKHFCSGACYQKWKKTTLLTKCRNGEISFLDLPKEVRDSERISEKHAYKSNPKTCPECGTVFYVSSSFGEYNKKYCSEKCMRMSSKYRLFVNGVKRSGFGNYKWKGGITHPKYCHKFNENLKTRVREFFDNKCILCGLDEIDNGASLSVHHVNYDKLVGCNGNKVKLVTLCKHCHGKVHKNKEYWEKKIESILDEIYNDKCYFSEEEYLELMYGDE